jgi:hypothetical protein
MPHNLEALPLPYLADGLATDSYVVNTALITGPATLLPPFYLAARRGGLNGAVGRSTDCKIAANIERGF